MLSEAIVKLPPHRSYRSYESFGAEICRQAFLIELAKYLNLNTSCKIVLNFNVPSNSPCQM